MLFNLLHLAISYAYFWISGYVVFSIFRHKEIPHPVSVTYPLAGFLTNIPLLSALSLFSPVNMNTFLIVSGSCLLYFMIHKAITTKSSTNYTTNRLTLNIIHPSPFTLHPSLVILCILLVITSSAIPSLPDMWGYHIQSIQWTEKYAAVPGLGNLSTKLAFNFGTFLPYALLSFRNILGQPLISLNSFLFLLVFLLWAHSMKRIQPFQAALILIFALIPAFHFFKPVLSSTSVEASSAALTLLLFMLVLWGKETDGNHNSATTWLILLILIILPIIKLSNSIFLLMIIPFWAKSNKRTRILIPIILLICWAPWLIRNYILSGYLWYPFPVVDFFYPDWKIPRETALTDFNWIRSWAREPFQDSAEVLNQPIGGWAVRWFSKTGLFTWFFLAGGLAGSLALLLTKNIRTKIPPLILTFFIVIVLLLISWFFIAPDPRFIIGPLVLFLTIPLILLLPSSGSIISAGNLNRMITITAALFLVFEVFISHPLRIDNVVKPAAFPAAKMKTRQINGISVNIPVSGVNCYDYPLPCSPSPNDRLDPRGVGLDQGFRLKVSE